MPLTRQTTTQGGSDRDESTRNGNSKTVGKSTSIKSGKSTTKRDGRTESKQEGKKTARPSTTTATSEGGQTATEDQAFNITFKIVCRQAIPCEEISAS